jgi:23S rRNA (uracil1939-C5)-methyltransferase
MLTPGEVIAVAIEKPAAGGRMIARHEGQILLVSDTIPGERVSIRIDRVEKRLAFASTVAVLEPSPDRRDPGRDPLCGGCLYAHIAYPAQVALKSEIVADAFARIGRIPLAAPIPVVSSPEDGYRMRARLQVTSGAVGFYREHTHDICDPRQTRQLTNASVDAIDRAIGALDDARASVRTLELSENIAADQRAMHFDVVPDARTLEPALVRVVSAAGLTGATARGQVGPLVRVGEPAVGDPISLLTGDSSAAGELRRQPTSFFQANRFLMRRLVETVLDAVPPSGRVLDLYAGVGLFSVALAARGSGDIVAVEGDRGSAGDLKQNAAAFGAAIHAVAGRVEDHAGPKRGSAATIIVDPPRTGMSREALDAVARHGASAIVYVSCDPPTMARDAGRLLDAGYELGSLRAFDLFPNTPHVETVGEFRKPD